MQPTFFAKPSDLRKWFAKNHKKASELLVGFYKKGSGRPSITWPQSVDEALCFGWIDGVRKSIDEDSYTIRFTPRKPSSIWSANNIKRVKELQQLGLMQQAGLEAYNKRSEKKSGIYAYEQKEVGLDKALEAIFKKNKKAWAFFQSQPPYYKKVWIWRITSAKQEGTKLKRLAIIMKASEQEKKIL